MGVRFSPGAVYNIWMKNFEGTSDSKFEMPKRVYIYRDNSKGTYENTDEGLKWIAPIVFECEANGIEEADVMFKKETGLDPVKESHIDCLSTDLKPEE